MVKTNRGATPCPNFSNTQERCNERKRRSGGRVSIWLQKEEDTRQVKLARNHHHEKHEEI